MNSATDLALDTPDGPTMAPTPTPPSISSDTQTLAEQLDSIQRQQQRSERRLMVIGLMLAAIFVVVIGGAVIFGSGDGNGEPVLDGSSASEVFDPDNIPLVEPVAADEAMILLADLEQVDETERPATRFIAEDLTLNFERELAFSNVRVREVPLVITDAADAAALAAANNADLILWGRYDDDGSEIFLQLGSLADYAYSPFTLEDLNDIVATRFELADEREQSLVIPVLGALNAMATADGDAYEIARNIALQSEVSRESLPEIPGTSVAAGYHRYIATFIDDTEQAIEEISASIQQASRNPMLYLTRALALQRVGRSDAAQDDINTTLTLAPDGWTMPEMTQALNNTFVQFNVADAAPTFAALADARPDDWYVFSTKGMIEYLSGDFEAAEVSLNTAIELGAEASFPLPICDRVGPAQRRTPARAGAGG